jgi:5-bromo-4-chloroindolyl phosphate hydrolysis protein
MKSSTAGNIIFAFAAGAVFLVFLFVLRTGIIFSIIAGAAAYTGLLFIFSKSTKNIKNAEMEAPGISSDMLKEAVAEGRKKASEIEELGKQIKNNVIKQKVESLLSTIKQAFDKQLAKLLEDDVMDLDVEISVLEKTMKSEGL